MWYRSRGMLRCFSRSHSGWLRVALCFISLAMMTMIFYISDLKSRNYFYISDLKSRYYFIPKNPLDLEPSISSEGALNNASLYLWRSLDGYDDYTDGAARQKPDDKLFDKLDSTLTFLKHPLFRVKVNGSQTQRHPWKFEKIIHQTWITEQIPGRTVPWVKSWLDKNPDWTYMFWTDLSCRLFIKEHYPSLLAVYDSWTSPVQKADMFRYIALFAFGGVYADLDMEVLQSLDGIRNWSSCILSREPELQTYIMSNFMNTYANNYTFTCNAFMASRSHHPFLYYIIARIVRGSPHVRNVNCPLNHTIWCTGPLFMSVQYGFYRRSINDTVRHNNPSWDVVCPEYEWFLPTFDETRLNLVKKGCRLRKLTKKQREVCATYKKRGKKNKPLDYSLTTHHWFHSYHYKVDIDTVSIDMVSKNLRWDSATEEENFDISYIGL